MARMVYVSSIKNIEMLYRSQEIHLWIMNMNICQDKLVDLEMACSHYQALYVLKV